MKTRPDLAYVVFILSRYCSNPESLQFKTLNKIFRYIKSTLNLNIHYNKRSHNLIDYTDANYAGVLNGRKFINNYIFMLYDEPIS